MTSENVVAQQVEVDLWFDARGRAESIGVAPDWGVDSSTLIQEVKLRWVNARLASPFNCCLLSG